MEFGCQFPRNNSGMHSYYFYVYCLMLTDLSVSYERLTLVTVPLPRHLAGNWRG